MKHSKDIEEFIRINKANFKTDKQIDKLTLDNSYKVMDTQTKSAGHKSYTYKFVTRNNIAYRIAAIVAILLVSGLIISHLKSNDNGNIYKEPPVIQTPEDMRSLMSINLAYNRGGLDEVEKQYEKAIKQIYPRPGQLTMEELFSELNEI